MEAHVVKLSIVYCDICCWNKVELRFCKINISSFGSTGLQFVCLFCPRVRSKNILLFRKWERRLRTHIPTKAQPSSPSSVLLSSKFRGSNQSRILWVQPEIGDRQPNILEHISPLMTRRNWQVVHSYCCEVNGSRPLPRNWLMVFHTL